MSAHALTVIMMVLLAIVAAICGFLIGRYRRGHEHRWGPPVTQLDRHRGPMAVMTATLPVTIVLWHCQHPGCTGIITQKIDGCWAYQDGQWIIQAEDVALPPARSATKVAEHRHA